jgi:dipeptidyl aminopeptidase/acylaminoacyl peptidase
MIRLLATFVLLVVLVPRATVAQTDSLRPLLDRASRYFEAARSSPYSSNSTRWLPGDRVVYRPETGAESGGFVMVDAKTGRQRTIMGAAALRERVGGATASLSWAIAPDSQRILLQAPSGGWAFSIAEGTLTPVDSTEPATRAMRLPQALSAPGSGMLAVRRDGGGFAVLGPDGRVILERPGEERYGWQVPGRAWSPDGKLLAVWRNDARQVHTIPIVDYQSAVERVEMIPYTKTGTPLVRSELYLVDPLRNRVEKVELPDDETYDYLAGWRPDGSEALVLSLSRTGKELDLLAVRASDGTVRRVLREERPESFVAALEFPFATSRWQVTPLHDNRHFLWISERDGWRHVYLHDYGGQLIRQVTRGRFPVQRVVRVMPDGESLLLMASADSLAPYDLSLYRQSLSGGPLRRITPEPGIHNVALSPSSRYFTDLHVTRSRPGRLLVRSVDGRASTAIAGGDGNPLRQAGFALPESLTVMVDSTRLYGLLYKPADFDPTRRYPVIDYIYAGPFASVVPWDYAGNIFSWEAGALAQMGFVVMLLDARGTPNRGKAFQDYNYGRIGQTEIGDHVAALRQAASTRSYMDTSRMGIYGHSWGGYYALRGMLTAPEVFKAGYAGAPGALEEEAIINEPNMGLLEENPAGYRTGSNLELAVNLHGALRIMHGTSDINASLSTTMRMAAALISANKQFELLIMPGQPHGPIGPARRYYTEDVRRFFVRTLGRPQ